MSEKNIQDLLMKHLINKGYPESSIRQDYIYHNGNNSHYRIDVAIIEDDEILEIYLLKSLYTDAKKVSREEVLKDLVGAIPIFFVGVNQDSELTFTQIKNTVAKFRSFYRALETFVSDDDSYVYFYRGHADIKYNIEPGIYRNAPSIRVVDKEHILFKEAIRHCPSDFSNATTTFEKLVKMQHYGLPTRLLDITTNPLVALYFACCSSSNTDGEVVVFRIKKSEVKYFDSDAVCILSNIVKSPSTFSSVDFKESEDESNLLYNIRHEKPHFCNMIEVSDIESVFCVLPKLDNPRIQKQAGAFFIYGVDGDGKNMASLGSAPRRIVISSKGKKDILKELSILGIDNSTLFPDIDNILKTIKEK